MDDQELKAAGLKFRIGEDLYGVSITELDERITILQAEIERISRERSRKTSEMTSAENFFKKS